MEKVRRYIEGCHGIIVLGLERSHAYFYRDKEGSEKELEATHPSIYLLTFSIGFLRSKSVITQRTGIENNYLESDADDIYKNENLIIERYKKLRLVKLFTGRTKKLQKKLNIIRLNQRFLCLLVPLRHIRLNSQSL